MNSVTRLHALIHKIQALPRYHEYDVVRRSSMVDYLSADQVDELLDVALHETSTDGPLVDVSGNPMTEE